MYGFDADVLGDPPERFEVKHRLAATLGYVQTVLLIVQADRNDELRDAENDSNWQHILKSDPQRLLAISSLDICTNRYNGSD
jgi:hypothetical protein